MSYMTPSSKIVHSRNYKYRGYRIKSVGYITGIEQFVDVTVHPIGGAVVHHSTFELGSRYYAFADQVKQHVRMHTNRQAQWAEGFITLQIRAARREAANA